MDTSLFELALTVANSPDPTAWLRTADTQITGYLKDPKGFVLNKAHKDMLPVIEEYAYDLPGFVRFVSAVRDNSATGHQDALYRFYRTVSGRLLQQQRRERFDRAITQAIDIHGTYPDYLTRMAWLHQLEQVWRNRRLETMASARGGKKGRVPRDELAEVLDAFWAQIDTEIEQGQVPGWDLATWKPTNKRII
jgi:hypothetical protein